jgi:hypothetical protein
MATNDLIPLFLADPLENPEPPGIGKAWDIAVISSLILKTSILLITAASIVFVILSVRNPLPFLANVTASLVAISAPQEGTGRSMPIIQSTAGAQALPPTASEAPTGNEIAAAFTTAYDSQTEDGQPPAEALLKQFQAWAADEETRDDITAAFEPADQSQNEIRQPPAEALLTQFQAWAAEEDARVQVQPVQDAQVQVHDAQAQEVQNARAQVGPVQKHRHVKPAQIARADIRPVKNTRAKVVKNARAQVQRERNVQAQVRPEQNALPQDRSVQNAETQWPERRFGWLY